MVINYGTRCTWHVSIFQFVFAHSKSRIVPLDRGVQMSGYIDHLTGKFIYVEDMEPELVVPDLTDFQVGIVRFLWKP